MVVKSTSGRAEEEESLEKEDSVEIIEDNEGSDPVTSEDLKEKRL